MANKHKPNAPNVPNVSATPLATLTFSQGTLRLDDGEQGLKWTLASYARNSTIIRELRNIAKKATTLSNPPYQRYSPADGAPGRLIAVEIQKELGGQLSLPEVSEEDYGLIY